MTKVGLELKREGQRGDACEEDVEEEDGEDGDRDHGTECEGGCLSSSISHGYKYEELSFPGSPPLGLPAVIVRVGKREYPVRLLRWLCWL